MPSQGGSTTGAPSSNRNWRSLEKQCDFGGNHLPIAVSQQPPLVNCFQDLYGDWMCNGSNIEVIRVLERRLNFQADWLVLSSNHHLDLSLRGETFFKNRQRERRASRMSMFSCDSVLGVNKTAPSQTSAGNYTGVLGLIGSGRACLSANGIMRTKERERDFTLSEPFDSFRLHLLLSKWVRDHDHIFVKPFNANTWLAILGSALIMVPIFYLVNTTSAHYRLRHDKFLRHVKARNYFRYLILSKLCGLFRGRARRLARAKRRKSSSASSSFARHLETVASSGGSVIHHLMVHHQSSEQSPAVAKLLERRERRLKRRELQRRWTLERREAKRALRSSQRSGFFRCAYIVWYVAGSLAGQGGETEDLPRASSTRILIAFWWLYLIVITSIHSGVLTAILTFPKQNDFIQTLDDFLGLKAETMQLAVERDSELAQLMSSPDNLQKSPLQVLFKPQRPQTVQDRDDLARVPGTTSTAHAKKAAKTTSHTIKQVDFQRHRQRVLDEVQRGECAYLEERTAINLIISQEYFDHRPPKCMFKSSRYPVDTVPMAFVLSKHLPKVCVEAINELLRRIMEAGLAQRWRRKYEPAGNDCLNTVIINAGDVDKIQFRHVELAFWLLSLGLLCGLALLLAEIVWLFTIDMDEDEAEASSGESSSCGSSCSAGDLLVGPGSGSTSTSSSSSGSDVEDQSDGDQDGLMLGHRRFLFDSRRRRELRVAERPAPIRKSGLAGRTNRYDRRRRRAMRAAERRARLLRRTVQLARRLHEGKIYSDLFVKFSHRFQAEARRRSLAALAIATGRQAVRPAPALPVMTGRGQSDLGGAPFRQSRLKSGLRRRDKVAPLGLRQI